MTLVRTRKLLIRSCVGLFGALATAAAIRFATYSGVTLFEWFEHSRYSDLPSEVLGDLGRAIGGLLDVDPVIGAVLMPGLLVAGLILAALYFSRRHAG